MSAPSVDKPLRGSGSVTPDLPTRQKNALRLLLSKPVITPEEVAKLDYRAIERAPGVGKNSLAIIHAWLKAHGFELNGQPLPVHDQRRLQRQRKLERAIDYLRDHGYEVLPPRLARQESGALTKDAAQTRVLWAARIKKLDWPARQ